MEMAKKTYAIILFHEKKSTERSDFLRFFVYICQVFDDFCLSLITAPRKVKNLTWQNLGQVFVAQELIKMGKLKCCGVLCYRFVKRHSNEKKRHYKKRQAIGFPPPARQGSV